MVQKKPRQDRGFFIAHGWAIQKKEFVDVERIQMR